MLCRDDLIRRVDNIVTDIKERHAVIAKMSS